MEFVLDGRIQQFGDGNAKTLVTWSKVRKAMLTHLRTSNKMVSSPGPSEAKAPADIDEKSDDDDGDLVALLSFLEDGRSSNQDLICICGESGHFVKLPFGKGVNAILTQANKLVCDLRRSLWVKMSREGISDTTDPTKRLEHIMQSIIDTVMEIYPEAVIPFAMKLYDGAQARGSVSPADLVRSIKPTVDLDCLPTLLHLENLMQTRTLFTALLMSEVEAIAAVVCDKESSFVRLFVAAAEFVHEKLPEVASAEVLLGNSRQSILNFWMLIVSRADGVMSQSAALKTDWASRCQELKQVVDKTPGPWIRTTLAACMQPAPSLENLDLAQLRELFYDYKLGEAKADHDKTFEAYERDAESLFEELKQIDGARCAAEDV